ncbi:hypothetical protein PROFUN_12833 [Planoprotostelium fungivorum]|uniref:Calponin-homology (CH) domain-containing protein n=1 Tax=Planoprotostelium fungivorum TaxID=1890364 RepID=A0A2P6N6I9_9EUKA|nr:hypothetical protein PROFUN_12833 [Planoprotostelium fungivorum]
MSNLLVSTTTARRKEQETATENLHAKTFMSWMNKHLAASKQPTLNPSVDLFAQLKDGLSLCRLLTSLYPNERLPGRLTEKPINDIQRLQNVSMAIDFLKARRVNVTVNSQDILDGNRKLILGLIWRLILDRNMLDPNQMSEDTTAAQRNKQAKSNLLAFCQQQVKPYSVPVQDLCESWYDGRAFCALVHSIDPSFDWNSVQNDTRRNLQLAFDRAARLGIPPMLDIDDMMQDDISRRPDEKCIMTYLSEFPPLLANRVQKAPTIDPEEERRLSEQMERMRLEKERKNKLEYERFLEGERQRIENEMRERMQKEYNEMMRREEEDRLRRQQKKEEELINRLNQLKQVSQDIMNEHNALMQQREQLERDSQLPSQYNYNKDDMLSHLRNLQEQAAKLREENLRLRSEMQPDEKKFLKLHVNIKEGRALLGMDLLGKSDPYIKLVLESQEYKSHTQRRTCHPQFHQDFELFVNPASYGILDISCWHASIGKDSFMGHITFPINKLSIGSSISQWLPLTPKTTEKVTGELFLTISLHPYPFAVEVNRCQRVHLFTTDAVTDRAFTSSLSREPSMLSLKKSSKLGGGSSTLPRPRRISLLSDVSDDLGSVSSSSSNYSKSASKKKPDDTWILDEDTYKNIISNPTEPLVAAYTLKFMLIRVKA